MVTNHPREGPGIVKALYMQRIASWLSLAKCKIEKAIDKLLNQQCSKLALLSYHNFNNCVIKQC